MMVTRMAVSHSSWVIALSVGIAVWGCGGDPDRPDSGNASAKLAYVEVLSGAAVPTRNLMVTDPRGAHRQIVAGDRRGAPRPPNFFHRPAWSADGEEIAFSGSADPGGLIVDIYVARTDGSGAVRRLTNDGASFAPVWSPDGEMIAFERFEYPQGDSLAGPQSASIWTMDTRGENERAITNDVRGRFDQPASFSPDGSQLAFTRARDFFATPASASAFAIGTDGSGLELLARGGSDPMFSPDGLSIAFVSNLDRNGRLCYGERCFFARDLYVRRVARGDTDRLTNSRGINESTPDWSPDGTRLAYLRGEDAGNAESTSIMAINVDGSCATEVAQASSTEGVRYGPPAWSPEGGSLGPLQC
jgi:Tol biopolymer transport system component